MLYVALILISAGLIIVLSALFLSSQKIENQEKTGLDKRTPVASDTEENQEADTSEGDSDIRADVSQTNENGYIELKENRLVAGTAQDETGEIREEPREADIIVENNRNGEEEKSVEFISNQRLEKAAPNQVSLFEDASDIVDYEKSTNTIDPSRAEYEKLKRIGRGKLEVVKDGISIFIEKNFYRFDFHKIDKLKSGENYIALFIKGSPSVKLLLFDGFTPLVHDVKKSFENYMHVSR